MRGVDDVRSGLTENYWRAEQGAAARVGGQRWGLPTAAAILLFNLGAFALAGALLSTDDPAVWVPLVMAPTVIAGAAVLVISVTRGNGPVVDFGLPRTSRELFSHVRTGLLWGVVALTAAIIVGLFVTAAGGSPPIGLDNTPTPSLGWRVVLAVWVVVGAPIGEELMFRGALWGALEKQSTARPAWRWLADRWVILVITAVLFALWHRELWRLPILICGGLALGIARMRSGSVAASTTAHAVNNTLPALAIIFAPMTLG